MNEFRIRIERINGCAHIYKYPVHIQYIFSDWHIIMAYIFSYVVSNEADKITPISLKSAMQL